MRIWVSDGDRRLQEGNGYGQVSQAVSRGLIERGHEVRFQEFPGMELALFICPPGKIRFGRQVPSAAITMHELDHLPESKRGWIEILNRLDLVITPTFWNKEVWERSGVTTPVAVVPLGIDPELYFPATGRRCTFLCVHENLGGVTSRENWRDTLRAYLSAFTAEDDVRLLVKTWKWKSEEFQVAREQLLEELHSGHGQAPREPGSVSVRMPFESSPRECGAPAIEILDGMLSAQEMRELYQQAWLFVKNANREGWSMPCTEAIACDTPVAATRIEPLLSHLPEQARWFELGDVQGLQRILEREYQRFRSHLRLAQRHDATSMTQLIEGALSGLLHNHAGVAVIGGR
jgi:glycosyltransferase involved in cell wall biosynthesis